MSTEWILDPTDPTTAFLASGTDPDTGAALGPVTLMGIQLKQACARWPRVIHNPSGHHMRGWPIHWRADRNMQERICPHGVGHPDPDGLGSKTHGCDGCCAPNEAAEVTPRVHADNGRRTSLDDLLQQLGVTREEVTAMSDPSDQEDQ